MSNIDEHRAAHEAFNRHDWDEVVRSFGDDMTYTDHGRDMTMKSRDEIKGWLAEWPKMLSDAAITDPMYFDAGDTTVAVFTGRGMNDGPLGPFPASGRRLSWPLCEVIHWDPNGMATSGEIFYDQMTILVQAGHMEAPPKG